MSDNYFSMLAVDKTFDLDLEQLSSNYLRLQQRLHPDRHINQTTSQKLLAANKLLEVSQAYQSLKSPFQRGEYLLTLEGYEKPDESHTVNNSELLMEQMELREQLSDLRSVEDPFAALEAFQIRVHNLQSKQVESVSGLFCSLYKVENTPDKEQIQSIANKLVRLRFLDKLQQEIQRFEEQLDDL